MSTSVRRLLLRLSLTCFTQVSAFWCIFHIGGRWCQSSLNGSRAMSNRHRCPNHCKCLFRCRIVDVQFNSGADQAGICPGFVFFAHLIVFCTSYCFAHLIALHFLFHCTFYPYFSFLPYICSCVVLLYIIFIFIILHCPLSGPYSITFHF